MRHLHRPPAREQLRPETTWKRTPRALAFARRIAVKSHKAHLPAHLPAMPLPRALASRSALASRAPSAARSPTDALAFALTPRRTPARTVRTRALETQIPHAHPASPQLPPAPARALSRNFRPERARARAHHTARTPSPRALAWTPHHTRHRIARARPRRRFAPSETRARPDPSRATASGAALVVVTAPRPRART